MRDVFRRIVLSKEPIVLCECPVPWVVTRSPVVAGIADDGDDIVHGLGVHDGRWTLVGGEVPGAARLVPGGIARGHELAVEEVAEGTDAGSLCSGGDRGSHGVCVLRG